MTPGHRKNDAGRVATSRAGTITLRTLGHRVDGSGLAWQG